MKKRMITVFTILVMCFSLVSVYTPAKAAESTSLKYCAHVQNIGWQGSVADGSVAGTTGQGLRLEALIINLTDAGKSAINYRSHIANVGWENGWKKSGQISGTTGQGNALEAVQIKLTDTLAMMYDVYYSVHVGYYGWTGWAKNGAIAGSTGLGARIEAIKIKLSLKGFYFNTGASPTVYKPTATYQTHIQNIGWQNTITDDGKNAAGTTGKGLRMEALKVNIKDYNGTSGVSYRAHVSNIGWQSWVNSGAMAGTTNQSLSIEAVQIKLTGTISNFYDVYYRVHSQNYGWLGWAKNGESAGTTGGGLRVEAIQITIKGKCESFNRGGQAYVDLNNQSKTLNLNINLLNNVGKQSNGSAACSCFALAYCRTILDGYAHSFSEYNCYGNTQYSVCADWSRGGYSKKSFNSTQETLRAAYESIKSDRPCILYSTGGRYGNNQHWMAVVGYQNVTNVNALSLSNFLVIDSGYLNGRGLEIENMGSVVSSLMENVCVL